MDLEHGGAPPSSRLRLDSGQVDVWLTATAAVSDELRPRYLQLFDESERARWERFAVDGAREQYLIGRALLRTSLSRYADAPEASWRFETNAYGCPFVAEPARHRDLRFNLSHTNGLVACIVTRRDDVGIDVENIDRQLDPLSLAPLVFAPPEIADVAGLPPEPRRERFFSYWTLKEAYIKARGMGVSLPLDGFWFELGDAGPRIHFSPALPDRAERWYFEERRPTASHKLALAVEVGRRTPEIRQSWVVPLASDADPGKAT